MKDEMYESESFIVPILAILASHKVFIDKI